MTAALLPDILRIRRADVIGYGILNSCNTVLCQRQPVRR
jgi:hypothetical protein